MRFIDCNNKQIIWKLGSHFDFLPFRATMNTSKKSRPRFWSGLILGLVIGGSAGLIVSHFRRGEKTNVPAVRGRVDPTTPSAGGRGGVAVKMGNDAPSAMLSVTGFVDEYQKAKKTLNGATLVSRYRQLAELAVRKLGLSNELSRLRTNLGELGFASAVYNELTGGAVKAALPGNVVAEEIQRWRMIVDPDMKTHLAAYLGAELPLAQLEELVTSGGLPPGMKEALVAGYSGKMLDTDPVAAVRFFMKKFPEGNLVQELLKDLPPYARFQDVLDLVPVNNKIEPDSRIKVALRRWADIDGKAAADYVAANPDKACPEQIVPVFSSWSKVSGGGPASDWTKSLPGGELRDHAAGTLAFQLAKQNPAEAWGLANLISNDANGEKTQMLQRIYNIWHDVDPAAADTALDKVMGKE